MTLGLKTTLNKYNETVEITKDLIKKRCKCMFTGIMVIGTIIDVEILELAVIVKVKFDEGYVWRDSTYFEESTWRRKSDEFGSLQYLGLI